ncbi:TPA: type I glyceraldehyde-3-phosphate dehydrogenase [Candidatus Falkowbacteria bacterium]|nr:type I glyceraldehyde-3-phosphate dehydrogenase [Candidatus Falkowbacteria bacterium]
MKKIAINGFGRIGRAALKVALSQPKKYQVVAVNDLASLENLAYLLRYDSAYGPYDKKVEVDKDKLIVGGRKINFYSIMEPEKLPWKKLKVDVVLECTGVFTKKEDASKHLIAGAKQVIISAPTKSEGVMTVVKGVNHNEAKGQKIIANASCTTNCTGPVIAVLHSVFGVEKALLTTVHATTATEHTVDSPDHKDLRRGRSALNNIIPTTTGAAIATTITLPSLKDKFDGVSVRVPIITGSLIDVVALLKKNTTAEEINRAFRKYSKLPRFKNILQVSDAPLVSSDIIGSTASAIVDLEFTRVVDGNLVKILAWYDNEWGYANRLVEMVSEI